MRFFYFMLVLSLFFAACKNKKNQAGHEDNFYSDEAEGAPIDTAPAIDVNVGVQVDSSTRPSAKAIDNYITNLHKSNSFNGAVLVAKKGKVIYKNAFGYANFKTKDTLTVNSSFQIASVSKQFTAMAIMMLEEEGKLNYDDSITHHIPDFPYGNITIRQLLNHTSGVLNIISWVNIFDNYWDTSRIASNDDVLAIFAEQRPSRHFRPGSRFSYNNVGYVLLASIVEKASGMPYHIFLKRKIFRPLGMKNTIVYDKNLDQKIRRRVMGHQVRGRWYAFDDDDVRNGLVGEKNIYSTVEDLFRWDRGLYEGVLVADSTLEEAFTRGKLSSGTPVHYGFGWRIPKPLTGNEVVYHFGEWRGFKASIVRLLDDESTVIVLTNTGEHVNVRVVSNRLISLISPKYGAGLL